MNRKAKTDSTEREEALIANPIYDHVFKYLMEDNKVARKFISAIIGEDVTELSFAPQEYVREVDAAEKSFSIYRLDFLARIRTDDGSKVVMIEVQKVSLRTDIMRFRYYLGGQYRNRDNSYTDPEGAVHAMPIYCIFFIGEGLSVKGVPVMAVNPQTEDVATRQVLKDLRNEFVESLHHRSWIVQIPELKGRRRNDLEILLSIFDQANRMSDHHILNIREERFPEKYRPIIRRLQQAASDRNVREAMQMEDDILEHFRIEERMTRFQLAEKDAIITEKDAIITEKDAVITEKDKIIAREQAEKEALLTELATLKTRTKTDK
ncbi:MAG: hypothetical protein LBS42_08800 [Tannerella sp.]|jgi:hypothetical protein|nr:hypothetical protein [Tannerella sp.]